MAKIIDPTDLADSATDNGSQEVYINTSTKTIKLVIVGTLSTDGVTMKALYSFLKEQWTTDPHTKNLAAFPFPMVPITDESFEFVDGWDLFDNTARYLIRDAGWAVKNLSGATTQIWSGIIGLGTIESNDQLYYYNGTGTGTNFELTGQVNQAVQVLSDPNGDGNYSDGFDRRTTFRLFAREYQQIYGKSTLSDIGVTSLTNQAYRFPITTAADLKINTVDATVGGANDPYQKIVIRYFDQAFTRDVDSATDRNFGIVIDVGTHSGVDGSTSAAGSVLTTAEGGILTAGNPYAGGTLVIHEGADAGTYTISGNPTATTVTITGTFPTGASNSSFTIYRATPVASTAEQIYELVQYRLRQASDIDGTDQTVTGKIADELLVFVGDTLVCGSKIPANPNGGGSGVIIEGFAAADTNRITFYDNTGTARTYPFVATLTLNFGANLVADVNAEYFVYFTTLPGAGNDFGESGAVLVDDNSGADMVGTVSAQSSITRTFNYDGNVQGGRTAGTDADVTCVALGLATGQYVRATGTIERSVTNSVSLVAALERNYANP